MQTGSLVNLLHLNNRNPAPVVGMGSTICYWTDRQACTVTEVAPNGKRCVVQEDTATRTDNLGMTDAQSYAYEANPNGSRHVFTLRNNGRWVRQGESKTGTGIRFGTRDQHHDYGF